MDGNGRHHEPQDGRPRDEGTGAVDDARGANLIDRRTVLAAGALAVLASPFAGHLLGSSSPPAANAAAAAAADTGSWSPPFDMRGVAIHATLTRTGDVLFFGRIVGPLGVDRRTFCATWNYRTGTVALAPLPYDRDIFCAGHSVLADGRVYLAGGHTHSQSGPYGVAETDTYDPVTRAFTPRPLLSQKRWYPTTVQLPDNRILIFGGQIGAGQPANTVNEYTPATNRMIQLPTSATRGVGLYPRMHLMPNGRILKSGPTRASAWFTPSTRRWTNGPAMVYGNRHRGNSILLAGGTRVLCVGGHNNATSGPTGTAEILDTAVATPRWQATGSLTYPRMLANTVLLPDGKVLIIGGGQRQSFTGPIRTPELYDPATRTWTPMAPHVASRMYHATALLLPDGRVLSAGQDDGAHANYGEIFSPPYLFKGARPTVTGAPATAGYGQQITVTTPNAASIGSVMLIRAGSVTHQLDTDQRGLPLTFTAAAGSLAVRTPANATLAPPGYYMLFVVNRDGVPSVAPWIRLG